MMREEVDAQAKMRLCESRRRLGVKRKRYGKGTKLEDLMADD